MIEYAQIQEWWKTASDGERSWRNKAIENLRFYIGDQWNKDDVFLLDRKKRPHITINRILPIVNFLSGYQRQNRYRIGAKPKRAVSNTEAEVMSEIISHIWDDSEINNTMSCVFVDGIVTARGWVYFYRDYEEDPVYGDLKVERTSPFKIKKDSGSSKTDLSDCNYIINSTWMDYDRLKIEFPTKVDEIMTGMIDEDEVLLIDSKKYSMKSNRVMSMSEFHKERVLVKETWYMTTKKTNYVIGLESGKVAEATDQQLEKYKAMVTEPIDIIVGSKRVLNLASSVGTTVLQDVENPYGEFNKFPFVQFLPFAVDKLPEIKDNELGVVDNLKDLQREVNKSRSQQLHIMNTVSHSGWFNKEGTGADPKKLEQFGSTPGIVIPYKLDKPEQIQPQIPSNAHILSSSQSGAEMKEVSGVNPDLLGERGARGEPGVVLNLRREGGLVVTEPLFDQFKLTHKLMGLVIIEIVSKSNIISLEEITQFVDITPQNEQLKMEAIQSIVNPQYKRYNVSVDIEPNTPTQRTLNFIKLLEITKALSTLGMVIPPDILLEASDLPQKEEIKQRLEQMMGQGGGGSSPSEQDIAGVVEALQQQPEIPPM